MPRTNFRELPLESLYELFVAAVKDMLAAHDSNPDNPSAFNIRRKQVEILLAAIDGKNGETE